MPKTKIKAFLFKEGQKKSLLLKGNQKMCQRRKLVPESRICVWLIKNLCVAKLWSKGSTPRTLQCSFQNSSHIFSTTWPVSTSCTAQHQHRERWKHLQWCTEGEPLLQKEADWCLVFGVQVMPSWCVCPGFGVEVVPGVGPLGAEILQSAHLHCANLFIG